MTMFYPNPCYIKCVIKRLCAERIGIVDCGSKGCSSEPYCQLSHCIVPLGKILYLLLSTGSIWEDRSRHD